MGVGSTFFLCTPCLSRSRGFSCSCEPGQLNHIVDMRARSFGLAFSLFELLEDVRAVMAAVDSIGGAAAAAAPAATGACGVQRAACNVALTPRARARREWCSASAAGCPRIDAGVRTVENCARCVLECIWVKEWRWVKCRCSVLVMSSLNAMDGANGSNLKRTIHAHCAHARARPSC